MILDPGFQRTGGLANWLARMRTDYIVIDDPQNDCDAKSELTANCGDLAGGRPKQNKERR